MRNRRKKVNIVIHRNVYFIMPLVIALIGTLLYIEPSHLAIIITAIAIISTITYLIGDMFLPKKISILLSILLGAILLLHALDILDIMNIVILGSLMVTLSILLYQK